MVMEIIDIFIPTLEYCSIIINFVEPEWSHIVILSFGTEYGLFYVSKEHKVELRFKTVEELKIKVEKYLQTYTVKTIEIEGTCGPPTCIYKL
jgi:hypothetical protein